jgi:hypothetical protein
MAFPLGLILKLQVLGAADANGTRYAEFTVSEGDGVPAAAAGAPCLKIQLDGAHAALFEDGEGNAKIGTEYDWSCSGED